MATKEEIIQRLRESKPPATDAATYLTIIEMSVSSAILPTLEELLDDAELTAEIGWDLVEILIGIPGSEGCLDRVARLGNPREVILKVLETMEMITPIAEKNIEEEDSDLIKAKVTRQFVTLCGMLGVLHMRLKVKAPSRFLHTTLDTVFRIYDPSSSEATTAVISLLRSLSGQKRPPLPTRKSSINVTGTSATAAGNTAPDPEADAADKKDAKDEDIVKKLLQSFVTCVIEAYANTNQMEWAARLLEYTYPEKIVSGKPTMMRAFNELEEFRERDSFMGEFVALAQDLGLTKLDLEECNTILNQPIDNDNPLEAASSDNLVDIKVSTGGYVCLLAYLMFSSDVFDAQYKIPDLYAFPHHHQLLKAFLDDDFQKQISFNSGLVEALATMALWLHIQSRIVAEKTEGSVTEADFMSYHHLITLVAVFHSNIRVRNVAVVVAGSILHISPEDTRISILEDLLENCMFASLQACAVAWLKDEIIAAKDASTPNRFFTPYCLETLQYALFPDLTHLLDSDNDALLAFWTEGAAFHMQVANFALFLFSGEAYKSLAPAGMAPSVEHRYVEPLKYLTETLVTSTESESEIVPEDLSVQLMLLKNTLERIPLQ